MKVVVLTRNPRGIASRFLARGRVPVEAVLLDEGDVEGGLAQMRRKARKLRRVGLSALPVGLALRRTYGSAGRDDVAPLGELGVPVVRVPSLNTQAARARLRQLAPDAAVSLDNVLIAEETFSIPRLGTINVHHGALPDYAGGPPVFWELADGHDRVGFTVHLIDAGIDTGPVLATGEVPIVLRPTLAETIAATIPALHEASLQTLEEVLERLGRGEVEARAQKTRDRAIRTTPALRDYLRVRRRLRHYDRAS